ncbi:MAG TPA: DUF4326 domain-containing protein [Pseudonocardiaceae bacterium]|nr:DUF4326 domain-containing protein [Pseudonocardiaceae bacterium]
MTQLPPEAAGWTRAERALAGALRDGWTVVVNVRRNGPHKHLVPWLQEAGLLTYVGHAGPRHSWPESDFANPFVRLARTDRAGAVRRYADWLDEQPELLKRVRDGELTGRALGCWCAPARCDAEVLAELASAAGAERPSPG